MTLLTHALLTLLLTTALAQTPADPPYELSAEDAAAARDFSPLPDPPADPTNAVYESPAAALLGRALFFDQRLSQPGTISCATCHDPQRSFTDGRRIAKAFAHHVRHTMPLWNVAYNRWFFWDGRKDTLWSQALAPFEDPREHATTRLQVVHALAADPAYVRAYEALFGPMPDFSDAARFPATGRPVPGEDAHPDAVAWAAMAPADQDLVNRVFVNVGKAIAAYERLLVSRRAPFDVFVEGLTSHDPEQLAAIPDAARRGFSLFIGKARCVLCHDGPNFTDLEFHSNRVPTGEGVDPGRALGIRRLQTDPFNTLSAFADDGGATGRTRLSLPLRQWHIPGEFKTPSLRNVARTAPYMHEGQMDTLAEVIDFYSTLEKAVPPGRHEEKILQPVHLTAEEKADLIAFLESLTDEALPDELLHAPASPELPGPPR